MKTELITAIVAAIAGVLIAFFVCNIFLGQIEPVTINTVEGTVSTDLADPDPEVFNYKALNPTVEVYVGDCAEYNASGECIEQVTAEEIIDLEDNQTQTQNQNQTQNQTQDQTNQSTQNNQENSNGSTN